MRYVTGAALAVLLASAGSAFAQAPPPPPPPAPPPPAPMLFAPPAAMNWTGLYAGGNMGGGFSTNPIGFGGTSTAVRTLGLANPPGTLARNPSGFTTGLDLGYNFAWGPNFFAAPLVLGVVADINYSGISDTQTRLTTLPGVLFPTNTSAEQSLNWFGTVRGKIGFSPWQPVMLYATGGFAYGQATVTSSVSTVSTTGGANCTGFCGRGSKDPVNTGWTVGGGWEWAISPAISVKAEYLYVDLGNVNQAYGDFAGRFPGAVVRTNTAINDNIFRVGFDYHFGAPPPPPAPMAMPAPPPAAPKVFIVFFDWDKDTITREGSAIIQQAADAYKSGAPVQLQVTGYTDRSGSPGYNQRLSERRANNVAKALAALGVPKDQMAVSGRGENDNRVPTADGVREPQNRRVEIVAP